MVYKIGDFCKTNISSYSAKEKWDEIHYLDTGNITAGKIADIQRLVPGVDNVPSRAKRKVQVNDIIYSTVRPNQCHYGIIKKYDPKMLVSTGFAVITVDPKVADADYIYYFLTQREVVETLHAIGEQSTSAYPSIKPSDIEELEIDLPDLKTQRAVAIVLSALDEKIVVNDKINDNLLQQVYALYDAWFVSFSKTDGEMPADWREGTLGDIAVITSGKRPPMKQATASADVTIPLVGAASIMGFTNTVLYNEPILVTGRVGTHGVVQRFQSPCWTSDNTLVIKSDFYEFTFQALQRVDYVNMNRGSTQPLITQTDLKNVPIVIPTDEVLLEYEKLAGSLMAMYESNRKENERLAILRDTLLPRLMSGEIEVASI